MFDITKKKKKNNKKEKKKSNDVNVSKICVILYENAFVFLRILELIVIL